MFVSITLPGPGLAKRFALIVGGLCDAAAARMSKPHTRQQQVAYPLLMLLWNRLRRTIKRFAALARRPAIVAPPRPRVKSETRKPSAQQRLPGGFAWVVRLLPEAAVFGTQLQHFLTDPEMAALIAANPKIAGLLRPLCRMLAVPGPPRPAPATAADAAPTTPGAREETGARRPSPLPRPQMRGPTDVISPLKPAASCAFKPTVLKPA